MIEKLDRKTAGLSERRVADHDGGLQAIQFQEVLSGDPGILREQVVGQGARRQGIEKGTCTSTGLQDVSRRRGEVYSCPSFKVVNTLACNIRLCIELIEISGTPCASDQQIGRGGSKGFWVWDNRHAEELGPCRLPRKFEMKKKMASPK